MPTSQIVHELDSATLGPFLESNCVVLLAVLMLPQSEKCQTFVPVFHSVSSTVIYLQEQIMTSWVSLLIIIADCRSVSRKADRLWTNQRDRQLGRRGIFRDLDLSAYHVVPGLRQP
jgi:hypothetical protein